MTADFLTRREVAAALRITPKTLRVYERNGIGPRPVRLSPRVARYPRSAIDAFAALRESGARA